MLHCNKRLAVGLSLSLAACAGGTVDPRTTQNDRDGGFITLPDAPDADVRAAWRLQLSESHPDRARARGLPAEFVEVAEAKSAAINAAYDQVVRERRALAFSGAA